MALPDDPHEFPRAIVRVFKFCALLAVQILFALIATAILESPLQRIFHPGSIATLLWREWIYSVVIGFGLGFMIQRTWPNSAAKWVWLLTALWFGFGAVNALGHGAMFSQITGTACENGFGDPRCKGWFLFTIPLLRAASYSAGAYLVTSAGHRAHPTKPTLPSREQ